MENTKLQLKDLNEKNAKALATSATKFLKSKGITVPHTMALDLAGVLAGYADWHGLQAAIAAAEKERASTPIKMSYEDFLNEFKPIKNYLDDNASGDGCGFETYGDELEAVKAAWAKNPGKVWTVVDAGGTSYISEGYRHVDRMFYFITNKPAEAGRCYEIPYGHDEGDVQIDISVLNRDTNEETHVDTRYGSSVEEVVEMLDDLVADELEEIEEAGGKAVVLLRESKA